MSKAWFALTVAVALAACDETETPIPEMPTYALHVQPIFVRRCTKCHGAGGTLNPALNPDGTPSGVGMPSICYLTNYEDQGDCSDAGIAANACKRGAHYCATPAGDPPISLIEYFVVILSQGEGGMPPLPELEVSARDKEVIRRWLLNPVP